MLKIEFKLEDENLNYIKETLPLDDVEVERFKELLELAAKHYTPDVWMDDIMEANRQGKKIPEMWYCYEMSIIQVALIKLDEERKKQKGDA